MVKLHKWGVLPEFVGNICINRWHYWKKMQEFLHLYYFTIRLKTATIKESL